jgi:type IVB pilus formation R64 PilN family outer membrane protein
MRNLLTIITVLSTVSIVGCSGTTHSDKWEEIKSSSAYQVNENYEKHKIMMEPKESGSDHVLDEFYVGFTSLDIVKRNRNNLPKEFYANASVYSKEGISEDKIPELIYKDFGLIVEFINQQSGSEDGAEDGELGMADIGGLPLDGVSDLTGINDLFTDTGTAATDEEADENLIDYKFNGDLKGLFDYLTVSIDKKWEYDSESQKIYIYKYRTEKFEMLQGKESIVKNTNISTEAAGGDGGGSSGNSQSIQFSSELNSWDDMQANIENMLSDDATSSFDPTQGTIIITDSDFVLSKIRKYVDQLNDESSKQVVVSMQVVNVKVSDSSNFGMNWTAVNQAVSSSLLGGNIAAGFDLANTATSGSGLLNVANTKTGMSAMFSALNEFSTFKVANKLDATTMNNKPVPMQVTTDVSYVSAITVTPSDVEGQPDQLTEEIAVVKEGITMTVTPKIHDQNIVLEYSMNLSVIDELKDVGSNGVQTPIVSSKNFTQRIISKNGQPLIVATFDKVNKTANSASPFSGDLWFLGGNEQAKDEKETVLIILTAYIVGN